MAYGVKLHTHAHFYLVYFIFFYSYCLPFSVLHCSLMVFDCQEIKGLLTYLLSVADCVIMCVIIYSWTETLEADDGYRVCLSVGWPVYINALCECALRAMLWALCTTEPGSLYARQ